MTAAGLLRAVVFFGALTLLPFVFGQQWVLNSLIFTLMYAGLASAWNLLGGYAGYPSLGHAAFFGVGAYAIAIVFENSVGSGYPPFFLLPLIGLGTALLSVPIGWIAMRTRADVFAIVTITLLFIAQTLAFNLRSLTGGAQGMSVAVPPSRWRPMAGPSITRCWRCWLSPWGYRSTSAGRRSACRSLPFAPMRTRHMAWACA